MRAAKGQKEHLHFDSCIYEHLFVDLSYHDIYIQEKPKLHTFRGIQKTERAYLLKYGIVVPAIFTLSHPRKKSNP